MDLPAFNRTRTEAGTPSGAPKPPSPGELAHQLEEMRRRPGYFQTVRESDREVADALGCKH